MSKYKDIINEGTVHNLKTNYDQNYVDTVQVVRCKDCAFWSDAFEINRHRICLNTSICTGENFYCGWGSKE